ncbi:hypothetical protein WG66_013288 [Moniliophthora roreri]|nr:hypothetical protein WG66_013288 [Moniliophthora roreri]
MLLRYHAPASSASSLLIKICRSAGITNRLELLELCIRINSKYIAAVESDYNHLEISCPDRLTDPVRS